MLKSLKYLPFLLQHYRRVSRFEKWGREKTENYQVREFRKIFEAARKIPLYRDLYTKAGVVDARFNSIKDLEQLPVIDKAYCRENGYEEYFVDRHLPGVIITPTSGSTGHPFQIRSHEKLELASPLRVIHAMRQFGWKPYEKGLEIWVEEKKSHKKLMRRLGLLISVSLFDPPDLLKEIIEREKPAYIFSNRTYFEILIEHLVKANVRYSPKFLMSSAGEVHLHHRKNIEGFFDSKLINIYGCLEAPTMAYSCPECDNFHVFQTTAIAEVINHRMIEGELCGDLVVTNLCNDIMPFIRYRTGDVVKVADPGCNCGRTSQVIGEILGRSDEVIKLKSGRTFNYLHFWMRLKRPLLVDYIDKIEQYKIWFNKKNDDILFQFRLSEKTTAEEGDKIIQNIMRDYFNDIQARYEIVKNIPLSESGKFKIIEVIEQ